MESSILLKPNNHTLLLILKCLNWFGIWLGANLIIISNFHAVICKKVCWLSYLVVIRFLYPPIEFSTFNLKIFYIDIRHVAISCDRGILGYGKKTYFNCNCFSFLMMFFWILITTSEYRRMTLTILVAVLLVHLKAQPVLMLVYWFSAGLTALFCPVGAASSFLRCLLLFDICCWPYCLVWCSLQEWFCVVFMYNEYITHQ